MSIANRIGWVYQIDYENGKTFANLLGRWDNTWSLRRKVLER